MVWTDGGLSPLVSTHPPGGPGHMAKRRVGVEYWLSMLEPVRPKAVSPDRALCLPTFSHFVIVNKTSLIHRLSLSLELMKCQIISLFLELSSLDAQL